MPRPVHAAREGLARAGLSLTRALADRLSQDLMPRNFHSSVPELPPESDPIWRRRQAFELDTAAQMQFVESALSPYLSEFDAALKPYEAHGFRYRNGLYESADAELLYALLRHLGPRHVLELGSGFSTMITAGACAKNAEEGRPAEFVAVDPQPRTAIGEEIEGIASIERRDANELPLERFSTLEDGDVLFIDTSHIVKLGSEVNRLVLEVLPALARGVWVHFHDIFLPYEYPRSLLVASGYFNEQYLLHAYLLGNRDWQVRLAVHALAREQGGRLAKAVPSLAAPPHEYRPSAFWMVRVPGTPHA